MHEDPVDNFNVRQSTMNHCSRTNRFEQYKYIYRVGVSSRQRVLFGYKAVACMIYSLEERTNYRKQ